MSERDRTTGERTERMASLLLLALVLPAVWLNAASAAEVSPAGPSAPLCLYLVASFSTAVRDSAHGKGAIQRKNQICKNVDRALVGQWKMGLYR